MAPQEFEQLPEARWIFGGLNARRIKGDNLDGHGTCVASKAIGGRFGIAKLATPVIVVLGRNQADTIDTVSQVLDDFIRYRTPGAKAAVNMSWGYTSKMVDKGWIRRFRDLLQTMVNEGMFLVASVGNDGAVSLPLPKHSPSFLTGFLEIDYPLSSPIRQP
jgi:hypothetical protein